MLFRSKPAPAYFGGKVVQEYGGGICQVSSTLYNAVLYANLEITERTNHGFKPSYVTPGLDATVSWGGPDFKFTNNRDYPVRISCDTSGKILKIYIYGLKRDTDYKVVLESKYVSTAKKNSAPCGRMCTKPSRCSATASSAAKSTFPRPA